MRLEKKYYKDLLDKDPLTQKKLLSVPLSQIGQHHHSVPEFPSDKQIELIKEQNKMNMFMSQKEAENQKVQELKQVKMNRAGSDDFINKMKKAFRLKAMFYKKQIEGTQKKEKEAFDMNNLKNKALRTII